MIHVFAFTYHRLCPNEGRERMDIASRYLQGQWGEVEQQIGYVDCEVCKLVVLIMKANGLEKLFNSNQTLMARTLRERMKGES